MNNVSKGSAAAASKAASEAFSSRSGVSLPEQSQVTPAEQEGRRRLADTFLIETSRILPDPEQPRKKFDPMELLELASSVKERGVKQPLTVRWNRLSGKYMIIDGGRRYEAAREAGLKELPCWVQHGDPQEVLIDQIVHNWQRSSLRPMETADALARLRDNFGLKPVDLCRVTGKGKSEISKFLALHDKVDPEVQQIARQDDAILSRRHLYSISKLKPDEQKQMATKVAKEKLTATQTEELVDQRSPQVRVSKPGGITARQRRFKTSIADVVITFRREKVTPADVKQVLQELRLLASGGKID